jgi:hypothetical protein
MCRLRAFQSEKSNGNTEKVSATSDNQCFPRRNNWEKGSGGSELAYSDEREKTIVAESTKIAYKVLIFGLIVIIPLLGCIQFFSLWAGLGISIYVVAVLLLTCLLDVAMLTYCIVWCRQYAE